MLHETLHAFVLAGGKSTRMGSDKAKAALDGRTLLEHALAILRQVTDQAAILGTQQLYGNYGVPVIEDIYPGCGPLAGIHAALAHVARTNAHAPLSLIIAVDTPFLDPKFLSYLAQRARESGAIVTTPEIAGHTQPLCAVYSLDFLPIAECALKAGAEKAQHLTESPNHSAPTTQKSSDYKIVPLFPAGRTCVITEVEMRRFAFATEMFENLNTPEDLERARRRVTKP
jgi:molybdopterin-guanine dinucleotide biosynthesis protein A